MQLTVIQSHKAPKLSDLWTHDQSLHQAWKAKNTPETSLTPQTLLWLDESNLHFLVGDQNHPAIPHPQSQPKQYREEPWRYDLGELFLKSADSDHYLELNHSPNGAWWSCLFSSPRQPAEGQPTPIPGVTTQSHSTQNSWAAQASIPLTWLQETLGDLSKITLNATCILETPDQIFLTAAPLSSETPDFHRPHEFLPIKIIPLA